MGSTFFGLVVMGLLGSPMGLLGSPSLISYFILFNFQLLPFGTGRRGCPGLSLAMQEVPSILAVMIQCFNWRVISPSGMETNVVDMTESPGLTIPRADDLVCVTVPRFSMNIVLNP